MISIPIKAKITWLGVVAGRGLAGSIRHCLRSKKNEGQQRPLTEMPVRNPSCSARVVLSPEEGMRLWLYYMNVAAKLNPLPQPKAGSESQAK